MPSLNIVGEGSSAIQKATGIAKAVSNIAGQTEAEW
jgi:hypothetical protein